MSRRSLFLLAVLSGGTQAVGQILLSRNNDAALFYSYFALASHQKELSAKAVEPSILQLAAPPLPAVLEELHGAFVLFRGLARRESSQVPASPGFDILFSRIETEFTGFKFPYHFMKRAREAPNTAAPMT